MASKIKARSLFDKTILIPAIWDCFRKLDPRLMVTQSRDVRGPGGRRC